jgi:hypothetical protein
VRYRAYFPPGYPYEERARAALEANPSGNIASFSGTGDWNSNASLLYRGTHECDVCKGAWSVWVPFATGAIIDPDPGKCPACSPVAAELDSKERARLLAELAAVHIVDLTGMLRSYPEAIPALVVACDAAQTSRAVAEYRSPCDIARIEELENALASVGLLV